MLSNRIFLSLNVVVGAVTLSLLPNSAGADGADGWYVNKRIQAYDESIGKLRRLEDVVVANDCHHEIGGRSLRVVTPADIGPGGIASMGNPPTSLDKLPPADQVRGFATVIDTPRDVKTSKHFLVFRSFDPFLVTDSEPPMTMLVEGVATTKLPEKGDAFDKTVRLTVKQRLPGGLDIKPHQLVCAPRQFPRDRLKSGGYLDIVKRYETEKATLKAQRDFFAANNCSVNVDGNDFALLPHALRTEGIAVTYQRFPTTGLVIVHKIPKPTLSFEYSFTANLESTVKPFDTFVFRSFEQNSGRTAYLTKEVRWPAQFDKPETATVGANRSFRVSCTAAPKG